MKRNNEKIFTIIFLILLSLFSIEIEGKTLWVSTTGTNNTNCDENSPCNLIFAGLNANDSDVLYLTDGLYPLLFNIPSSNVTLLGQSLRSFFLLFFLFFVFIF